MWTTQHDYLEPPGTLRLQFYSGNTCLSYDGFLQALVDEPNFRNLLIQEMQAAPFVAFRWETPPVTTRTLEQPFACLLHDSPDLNVRANPTDFEDYFESHRDVVCFENPGADAQLVVPCPIDQSANYSHIAAFHRSAPHSQQQAFWVTVALAVLDRVADRPLWLSTAGGGVDWLHVRLDDRPKYYRHRPWRDGLQET